MKLDAITERMLATAKRYQAPSTRQDIIDALVRSGIEPCERWIEYQQKYGGMTIEGCTSLEDYQLDLFYYPEPERTLSTAAALWSLLREIVRPTPVDRSRPTANADLYDDLTLVRCGSFRYAQFSFNMDRAGTIYSDDLCIARSIETLIRHECVGRLMLDITSEWIGTRYYPIPLGAENHEPPPGLREVEEASDGYSTWWSDGRSFVSREVLWGSDSLGVRIFSQSEPEFSALKLWLDPIVGGSTTVTAVLWPYRHE
jgi:hypothetical protein